MGAVLILSSMPTVYAAQTASPPVLSAGAGSLGLSLGGAAIYHGQREERPVLGQGQSATRHDIPRALKLVRHSLSLWLLLYLAGGLTCA